MPRRRRPEPDPTLEDLAAHYGVSVEAARVIMIYAREVSRVLADHMKVTDEDRAELGRMLADDRPRASVDA